MLQFPPASEQRRQSIFFRFTASTSIFRSRLARSLIFHGTPIRRRLHARSYQAQRGLQLPFLGARKQVLLCPCKACLGCINHPHVERDHRTVYSTFQNSSYCLRHSFHFQSLHFHKELKLSYCIGETLLFTIYIYTHYGNVI